MASLTALTAVLIYRRKGTVVTIYTILRLLPRSLPACYSRAIWAGQDTRWLVGSVSEWIAGI